MTCVECDLIKHKVTYTKKGIEKEIVEVLSLNEFKKLCKGEGVVIKHVSEEQCYEN